MAGMLLQELIERQIATSTVNTFTRRIDRIADDMAADLFRDAEFRAEVLALAKEAFRQALVALKANRAEEPPS